MKKPLLFPLLVMLALAAPAAADEAPGIRVNLGPANTLDEPGFTNWTTADNSTPDPITIDGVEFFLVDSISDETEGVIRSLRRGDTYSGPLANVNRSWWGARLKDQRANDGPPYDSGGFLTLGIRGSDLGAGAFVWTSWHHDFNDQRGYIDIDVSVDGGETFTNAVSEFKIVNGNSPQAPNPASFTFISNGTDDIHIRFINVEVDTNTHSTIFALVNGFEIVADPTFRATILPATPPETGFILEWNSRSGKQYAIRTRDNLDQPRAEWDVLEAEILPTPPMNQFLVQPDGPRRFYVIEEADIEPLFTADFEENGNGFTVVPGGTGSQWQHGTPDSDDQGGGFDVKSGNNDSEGAWGVNLTGPYDPATLTSLRSPAIDLSGVPAEIDPLLYFALALDMNTSGSLVVRALEDATGDPIGDPLLELSGMTFDDWQRLGPFPLPRQVIRLEWTFSDPGNSSTFLGAYLDDVEITIE